MKVKITLLEEVLGSSPSNEELLATYIASKAPTSDLTTEEVDNIKAQNAEDRITVFPKTADGTPFLYDYQVKGMDDGRDSLISRMEDIMRGADSKDREVIQRCIDTMRNG